MPSLAEKRANLEKRRLQPPVPKELSMFIVTRRVTTVDIDRERGETLPKISTEAHIERELLAVDLLFKRREAGDDRLQKSRVFELTINADGTPTIGREIDEKVLRRLLEKR